VSTFTTQPWFWIAPAVFAGLALLWIVPTGLDYLRLRRAGAARAVTVGVQFRATQEEFQAVLVAAAGRLAEIGSLPNGARYSGFFATGHYYYFGSTSRYPASARQVNAQLEILKEELARRDIWHRQARSVYRGRRYGVLFGLEEGFGTGIVHSAEEVRRALRGHRVKLMEATLYSAYLERDPYQEAAVVVLTNEHASVQALTQFAGRLNQEFVPVVARDRWTYTVQTAIKR
jgi:hypothetical protein